MYVLVNIVNNQIKFSKRYIILYDIYLHICSLYCLNKTFIPSI